MSERKYYWLKLDRQFFKRHDIRIVEAMPNGKDYILFYLKLLCESISHDGELRFSEAIPYNEQMLAVVTDTNVDVVRAALQTFQQLNMLEVLDDGTLYMTESQKMLGSETGAAERMRRMRERNNVTPALQNRYIEKEIEKDIEKDIEIDIEKEIDVPWEDTGNQMATKRQPNGNQEKKADAFATFAQDDEEMLTLLKEFEAMRKRQKKPMTDRAKQMLVDKLKSFPEERRKPALEESIYNCWSSVYDHSDKEPKKTAKQKAQEETQKEWGRPVEASETDRLLRLTREMQ